MILDRYRRFGGAPRHIFLSEDRLEELSVHKRLRLPWASLMQFDQPLGIECSDFIRCKTTVMSNSVAELIYFKYTAQLWKLMLKSGLEGSNVFEGYCRMLMARGTRRPFSVRDCVSKQDKVRYKNTNSLLTLEVASQSSLHLGSSMPQNPRNQSNHKLIDFIYQDEDDSFHAFQVTTRGSHSACVNDINELKEMVGNAALTLYYLVPCERFHTFVTDPVNPTVNGCRIYHVLIPNPGQKRETTDDLMELIERIMKYTATL